MEVRCQHCDAPAVYEHTEECARCATAREKLDKALEGLPYLVVLRLTAKANSRARSAQQETFAAAHPEHYQKGWHKRHVATSEFFTAAGRALRKVTEK